MKEIGEFLKSSRIKNGVSLEEAADDLNLSAIELENIEDGNIRAFKDIFALKELVKNYGKYLGVETDSIVDEFNDFMFEHTSKISLDDIKEAKKMVKDTENIEKNKISSPYTMIPKSRFSFDNISLKYILIPIGIVILLFIVIFILFNFMKKDDSITSELLGNVGEDIYEFTY